MAEDPRITSLRDRLKSAVRNQQVHNELAAAVRSDFQARSSVPFFGPRRALAATSAILLLGAGIALYSRQESSALLAIVDRAQGPRRIGIGGHVRCAVLGRSAQRPLTGRYPDLPGLLAGAAPAGFKSVSAHQCDFEGRNLNHLVFQNGSQCLSLIVTSKLGSDSLGGEGGKPDEDQVAIVGRAVSERFVFVVSDLTPEKNQAAADSMLPLVLSFLSTQATGRVRAWLTVSESGGLHGAHRVQDLILPR